MCQQTTESLMEYCETSVLWKGGTGAECICQTDYCNNSRKVSQSIALTFLPLLVLFLSRKC